MPFFERLWLSMTQQGSSDAQGTKLVRRRRDAGDPPLTWPGTRPVSWKFWIAALALRLIGVGRCGGQHQGAGDRQAEGPRFIHSVLKHRGSFAPE